MYSVLWLYSIFFYFFHMFTVSDVSHLPGIPRRSIYFTFVKSYHCNNFCSYFIFNSKNMYLNSSTGVLPPYFSMNSAKLILLVLSLYVTILASKFMFLNASATSPSRSLWQNINFGDLILKVFSNSTKINYFQLIFILKVTPRCINEKVRQINIHIYEFRFLKH